MSKLNIGRIQNENEDGSASVSGISTFSSTAFLEVPKGTTAQRPDNPQPGMIRFNTDSGHLEYYTGDFWDEVLVENNTLDGGNRGLFSIIYTAPSNQNVINYVTISTLGNAQDFGDLVSQTRQRSACSSSTRGLVAGGYTGPAFINSIDYITISSTGNALDFGDLSQIRGISSGGSCASSTRGLFSGGYYDTPVSTRFNIIDYVTIASTGNAVDFGDLIQGVDLITSCSSSIRGIFAGGRPSPGTSINIIQYITISTTGNTIDFGDLSTDRTSLASCSNSTRGIFGGGGGPAIVNTIEFITISTLGNAQDFGDLTLSRAAVSACSSSTRGVFGGGYGVSPFPDVNVIDYITLLTTGNATDFGDLTQVAGQSASCSNGHGGL